MTNTPPNDLPVINTHALGKFEFCARAGVIAWEMDEAEETDDTARTPRLDYLPRFDVAKMKEEKKKIKEELPYLIAPLVVGALVLWFIGYYYDYSLALFLALGGLPLGRLFYLRFRDYIEIKRRLKREANAKPFSLGAPSHGTQKFKWWDLLNKGDYVANESRSAYVEPELGLSGNPHRIVTHLATRIPVILHGEALNEPKPYHRVRLGAYAFLIESAETIDGVPWGIILEPESMMALAVPLGAAEREKALLRLEQFRAVLDEVARGEDPEAPPETFCYGCPYGRPRVYRRGQTDTELRGRTLKPHKAIGEDRRSYHSLCGDRFRETPPHARAIEKGLQP